MRWGKRILRGLLAIVLVLVGTLYFLWPSDPPDLPGVPGQPPYLTVFMIDGLSQQVFEEELAAGHLPQMAAMVAQGTYVKNGISSFPSMTGYGFYPFLTGQDAAKSGILGLRWFDRRRAVGNLRAYVGSTYKYMNLDLLPEPRTLYERVHPAHSFSINAYSNRGVHRARFTGWRFAMAKYKNHWWLAEWLSSIPGLRDHLAPNWDQVEKLTLQLALEDLADSPKVQWITFTSPDTYSHVNGVDGEYRRLVRGIDSLFGQYRVQSRALGQEDQRIYALVTDHGVESAVHNIDLVKILTEAGLNTQRGVATSLLRADGDFPLENLAQVDAMVVINGNLLNHLYLRNPGPLGWAASVPTSALSAYPGSKGSVDVPALLVSHPGLELVISRPAANQVLVQNKGGQGRIVYGPDGYLYQVIGQDPLGYAGTSAQPLLQGAHAPGSWLAATATAAYPYAVPRIYQVMTATSPPDILVTAAPGYDLAEDYELFVKNYRGGHGGLRAAQVRVPYVLVGPGVPAGRVIRSALAEDIGVTLSELLGLPPQETDGQPLF